MRRLTPRDAGQEVSVGLYDEVEEHHDERKTQAPDQIHDDGSSTLGFGRYGCGLFRIHDICKSADNAESGCWKGYGSGNHDLHLDVTETLTDVAVLKVVCWPYKEVHETE